MKLNASKSTGSDFQPHPETDAPIQGVVVDRTPTELRESDFQGQKSMKRQFKIVVESSLRSEENGKPFCIWSRWLTESLHEKAGLRKMLADMFGRDVAVTDADEEGDVDIDRLLIGHPVKFIVKHAPSKDGTKKFANFAYIAPDKSEAPYKASGEYVRVQDRPDRDGAASGQQSTGKPAQAGDWRQAVIHSGPNKGKRLCDLTAEELPVFLSKYNAWLAVQPRPSDADMTLGSACRAAQLFLDSLSDGIDF